MKNLKKAILISLTLFSINAYSQFSIPVKSPKMNADCFVITNDGTKVSGKWVAAFIKGAYLFSVTVKEENGNKQKFRATDIQKFGFKPGKASAFEALTGDTGGHMRFSVEDMEKIMDREWVYFVSGSKKIKKDKPCLLQLLNASWEQPIAVFVDPKAKTSMGLSVGGMSVVGGRAKSYMITKNGNPLYLKKAKYDKMAKELYGDCPEFKKDFPTLVWKDLPLHVLTYNKLMKN